MRTNEVLLTTAQAAKQLEVSASHVKKLVAEGKLLNVSPTSHLRIPASEVAKCLGQVSQDDHRPSVAVVALQEAHYATVVSGKPGISREQIKYIRRLLDEIEAHEPGQ